MKSNELKIEKKKTFERNSWENFDESEMKELSWIVMKTYPNAQSSLNWLSSQISLYREMKKHSVNDIFQFR